MPDNSDYMFYICQTFKIFPSLKLTLNILTADSGYPYHERTIVFHNIPHGWKFKILNIALLTTNKIYIVVRPSASTPLITLNQQGRVWHGQEFQLREISALINARKCTYVFVFPQVLNTWSAYLNCRPVTTGARLTKAYGVTIQRYRNSHANIEDSKMHILHCMSSKFCVKFQRCPLKFHTKFSTHTPQNMYFTGC